MRLPTVLSLTHQLISQVLEEGCVAVDATVGNGHDTLFLAHRVGASGLVIGFDVQEAALDAAEARLLSAGLSDRVSLMLKSHDSMADWVRPQLANRLVRAVMFNLGYRPGGDRSKITRPETTLPALESAMTLLAPGGLLTAVLYPGHAGGQEETEAVLKWAQALVPDRATVLRYEFLNPIHPSPILLALVPRSIPSTNA